MATVELPSLHVDVVRAVAAGARPVLVNRDPGPGEIGVPVSSHIALELVDPGPRRIDRTSVRIQVDGSVAYDGVIQPGFDGPAAAVVQTADTLALLLDPIQLFSSQATVTVRVVAATLDGQSLDETYTFTIEDRTAPQVTSAQAISPDTICVGFDEPVTAPQAAHFVLKALDTPAVPLNVTEAVDGGSVLTLQVHTEMTPDVRYHLVVEGVTDLSGNPVMTPTNRVTFTGFRPAQPAGRRFQLWEMLPKHNRRADLTGDLWRFIACLQEVTDLLLADIDHFPDIFDLERAPEPFVDLILQDLGNPLHFDLDVLGKQRLASVLVEMYRQKGTALGIINAVRFFLGVEVQAVSTFVGDGLVLGESLLGVDWILGPSDSFARYAFDVVVGEMLTDTQRAQLRAIVEHIKPAHTHFVDLIEPTAPSFIDHWELGVSEVGVSADLH